MLDHGDFTTIDVPSAHTTSIQGINKRGELVGRYSKSDGYSIGFVAVPHSKTTPSLIRTGAD
jgi:hypothetical protein